MSFPVNRRDFLRLACAGGAASLLPWSHALAAPVGDGESSVFGSKVMTEAALIGIFYDLKQDQQRKPLETDYPKVFCEFLDKGWDETVLNRFFRVTAPVYSTDIMIPRINAADGPRSFGVEKIVQPRKWFVHYKGQVSPPEDGVYRFRGFCDDFLAVGVNGKTVLISLWNQSFNKTKWVEPETSDFKTRIGLIRKGDWIPLKKDEVIDLDIIIGEYPGGRFNANLLYEKQGATYAMYECGGKQQPILPVFQLAPRKIDPAGIQEGYQDLKFTTDLPPWKCVQ